MSDVTIPDEAVEAAASALHYNDYPHPLLPWSTANDGVKIRYGYRARAALEAAASAMLAAERERIAQAIEAKASDTSYTEAEAVTDHLLQAAQIARGVDR